MQLLEKDRLGVVITKAVSCFEINKDDSCFVDEQASSGVSDSDSGSLSNSLLPLDLDSDLSVESLMLFEVAEKLEGVAGNLRE